MTRQSKKCSATLSLSLPAKRQWEKRACQEEDDTVDLPFDEVAPQFPEADITDADGNVMHTTSTADILMNAEVVLPQGEDMRLAKVVRRSLDSDGKVTGNYNDIPVLNTMLYDVMFPDGTIKPYPANIIAQTYLIKSTKTATIASCLREYWSTPRMEEQWTRRISG